jgi:hypothetical protein
MRRYLADKGDSTEGLEIRALVPKDLREPGDSELGNRFGLLAVELPVGVEHPIERLTTVRQRMLALKASYEPATTLGLLAALGYAPKMAQEPLLDLLASRATAVMTNVPGPTEPLTVAGSRLKQWLSWVPQSGDIGMGVSIFSYAGEVQFGLITDAALIPDPERSSAAFPRNSRSTSIAYCSIHRLQRRRRSPLHLVGRLQRWSGARRETVGEELSREFVRGWRHMLIRERRFLDVSA